MRGYRYGFQGQEEDGETGWVNYKYRMHNPVIGRFFAIDPLTKKYPHNSPYAFSENKVIQFIELEGLEIALTTPWYNTSPETYLATAESVTEEHLHTALDIAGGAPVVGEPIDALHGVVYLAQGKYYEATLSGISILPIIGDAAAKGWKYAAMYGSEIPKLKGKTKWFKSFSNAVEFANNYGKYGEKVASAIASRSNLRNVGDKMFGSVDWVAHHVIPVSMLKESEVVRKAVEAGFKFNGKINGMPIETVLHNTGGHKKYNSWIKSKLDNWANDNIGFDGEAAKKFITETLLPDAQKVVKELTDNGQKIL
ncbi:RHS repeat-associated core domain-containing protein [Flammeovirga aprica]|uniref:RHS repeat-associated core domain-containing protein n=1 Tax=Flammeovirga aprica JL-4 TaxID=694437 RepID=A0A7X9S226_9BACT|nr:RHS repeat-associated core domain-containing protein [Flammeovirga aprica]NME72948.1 hypothetical protein [Flammeovirga aprica JL-4]